MDTLFLILGIELGIAVLAFLAGGPFGPEDVVKVFIGINVIGAVLLLAAFLIHLGVS